MARVLVIDDDVLVRRSLSRLFEDMEQEVLLAENLAAGLALAEEGVDVVYLDLDLPDGDGLDVIDRLAATRRHPEVIVLTGTGSTAGAQKTLQSHAWDYIVKPASPRMVMESLESALDYRKQVRLEETPPERFECREILGEDPSMLRALEDMAKAARSDASVLLSGETGVGKELVARAIHKNSPRGNAPFVVVDCSSMTEPLVESMLHGHLKGSFTGAHMDRRGLVAEADGGTLFLDEVGELSLALQKSFLRVLQERRFRPVGSLREQSSDFRVVAATNRDLDAMAREGTFRSDLLFRIRTVEIVVPPLRDRGSDRERLAEFFVGRSCGRYGQKAKRLSGELCEILSRYDWPGNVRELENVMEAAVIGAGRDPVIYPKHLPTHVRLTCIDEPDAARGGRIGGGPYPVTGGSALAIDATSPRFGANGVAVRMPGANGNGAAHAACPECGALGRMGVEVVEASSYGNGGVPGYACAGSPGNGRATCLDVNSDDRWRAGNGTAATRPLESEASEAKDSPLVSPYREHKALRDREYFTRLLETVQYDIPKASRISGLSIPSMYRHLARAGIPPKKDMQQTGR